MAPEHSTKPATITAFVMGLTDFSMLSPIVVLSLCKCLSHGHPLELPPFFVIPHHDANDIFENAHTIIDILGSGLGTWHEHHEHSAH
jgi:hypothetical protein